MQPAHQRVMVIEAALQRPLQVGDLGAHLSLGQFGEHLRAALSVDERLHHRACRLGRQFGGHRVDLDPGVLQHVAQPLQLAGARLGQLGAVTDHVPGCLDVGGRNETAAQQPALQQTRQPLGIGEVRLATRHVLDMPGVAHHDLLEIAVLDQRVIHRHRVDPGRFHRHVRHALRGQPPRGVPQHPVERLEGALDRRPPARCVTRRPNRHRDRVLADIDRRAPLIENLHNNPALRARNNNGA